MRIVYLITRGDAVGGASVHVRDLSRAMIERGHDVTVLLGGRGPVIGQLESAGIRYRVLRHLVRPIDPWHDWRAIGEVASVLADLRPDLLSTHTAKAGWVGRAAAARTGVPALYTPHGWAMGNRISRLAGPIFAAAERFAARRARAIICVCEYERRLALQQGIGRPDQFRVIHNGVRDVPAELRADPSVSPARLISVARLQQPKDHATLLHALAALRNLNWTLELVGEGPLEPELRGLAARLGLGDRVRFAGYQPDPAAALARSQIFVLSTRSEGFPRSILEAMRAGLPVVASDVGGISEAVRAGESGLIVPSASPRSLSAALAELIKNPSTRQRMGEIGRLTYGSNFRFERMLEGTLDLYVTVVRESRPRF